MTITVKNKLPLVVPPAVSRRAGIKSGDKLELIVSGSVITIMPKPATADDEHTPSQRRAVDYEIAKGLEDIRNGRVRGPFTTADAAIADLHLRSLVRSRKEVTARKSPR